MPPTRVPPPSVLPSLPGDASVVDSRVHRARWRVRIYELDSNGHVNNAVYLNYAEQVATEHAEKAGFGRDWLQRAGGTWVVHRHEVTYHRPAQFGDELELETCISHVRGARGFRRTLIRRVTDAEDIAEILTEWVWVRLPDGRPSRVPTEVAASLVAAVDGDDPLSP